MTQPSPYPARRKARKRALDILFEADLRGVDAAQTLADAIGRGTPPVRPYTITVVEGVLANRAEVDGLIASSLREGWTLDRMPRVDRGLARIAAYELLYSDTEPKVAVAEAVGLAAELSTADSPAFLNGVLGTILTRVQAMREAAAEADAAASAAVGTDQVTSPE